MNEKCPYCGSEVIVVNSTHIYGEGHNYGKMKCCSRFPVCDTYSGIIATVANKELRELRKQCHAKFDVLWKSGKNSRNSCYRWLQKVMGMRPEEAHIAQFNVMACLKLLHILKVAYNEKISWTSIT